MRTHLEKTRLGRRRQGGDIDKGARWLGATKVCSGRRGLSVKLHGVWTRLQELRMASRLRQGNDYWRIWRWTRMFNYGGWRWRYHYSHWNCHLEMECWGKEGVGLFRCQLTRGRGRWSTWHCWRDSTLGCRTGCWWSENDKSLQRLIRRRPQVAIVIRHRWTLVRAAGLWSC